MPAMVILALIPLVLSVTTMQWMKKRPAWQFVVVNLAVTIIPAAIAVGMVAIPFMKAMKEGANEGM